MNLTCKDISFYIFQHKFHLKIHDLLTNSLFRLHSKQRNNYRLYCLLIDSDSESFHFNVNVGDKFLTGITNRYTRQSTDYSLQYKEFHFIPPALVVVGISTHLVRFPL